MGFQGFRNVHECSERLSDVLRFSDMIRGVIVSSELFFNGLYAKLR